MLHHASTLIVDHLQGAFFGMCSLCFNLYVRNSTCD